MFSRPFPKRHSGGCKHKLSNRTATLGNSAPAACCSVLLTAWALWLPSSTWNTSAGPNPGTRPCAAGPSCARVSAMEPPGAALGKRGPAVTGSAAASDSRVGGWSKSPHCSASSCRGLMDCEGSLAELGNESTSGCIPSLPSTAALGPTDESSVSSCVLCGWSTSASAKSPQSSSPSSPPCAVQATFTTSSQGPLSPSDMVAVAAF
mmetsp:Transcript_10929/g.19495  ORF Transcript_10929/g.19495 Transcript_10929/m.19495 type:complete len:206 (-) Transcript_10929:3642-4259(-)